MTPTPGPRRGISLIEAMVVVTIIGIMASTGVPRFCRAIEQSRADIAAANLRAIWSAERLYWLANNCYAYNLSTLMADDLLDPGVLSPGDDPPYTYSLDVDPDLAGGFRATATRSGGSWSGSFAVDETGTISGRLEKAGENPITSSLP